MGARENKYQISENDILHMKFQNFTCVFTILVKFDNHFLGLPWKIFAKHSYKSYNHRVRWMGGQMGSGKTRFYTFYYLLLLLLLFSAVLLYMHVY